MNETPAKTSFIKEFATPISIVVAGALMGVGFYFSSAPVTTKVTNNGTDQALTETGGQPADTTSALGPVTEADHIKGDINAPVKIVEFSDFECPFCKRYHETLETVLSTRDDVAWVYRQFPLEQLHPVKAMAAAMASECVAELGGNDAFWTFTDGYFRDTLTNNKTDIETLIPKLVTEAGVDQTAFSACFDSGRHQEAIDADIAEAIETGGRGTPWSVLVGPTGKTYPINGAQPQPVIEQLINLALEEA